MYVTQGVSRWFFYTGHDPVVKSSMGIDLENTVYNETVTYISGGRVEVSLMMELVNPKIFDMLQLNTPMAIYRCRDGKQDSGEDIEICEVFENVRLKSIEDVSGPFISRVTLNMEIAEHTFPWFEIIVKPKS